MPRWFSHPHMVTNPSTNRARHRATMLIETSALPLSHVTTIHILRILSHIVKHLIICYFDFNYNCFCHQCHYYHLATTYPTMPLLHFRPITNQNLVGADGDAQTDLHGEHLNSCNQLEVCRECEAERLCQMLCQSTELRRVRVHVGAAAVTHKQQLGPAYHVLFAEVVCGSVDTQTVDTVQRLAINHRLNADKHTTMPVTVLYQYVQWFPPVTVATDLNLCAAIILCRQHKLKKLVPETCTCVGQCCTS